MPSTRLILFAILIAPFLVPAPAHAETTPGPAPASKTAPPSVEFHARHYERDLRAHAMRGHGEAWVRYGTKELHADDIAYDLNTKQATASGNVHITDGPYEIWCARADYNLQTEDATLQEATVLAGQLVMMGSRIAKLGAKRFEIDDGSYTNCNVNNVRDPSVGKCQFDWKVYGRHFSITLEGYAHVNDALVYVSQIPLLYAPYFIAPIKSHRESGLLMPYYVYNSNLGSGMSFPYFQTLGPWQDVTFIPTYYTKVGYHLGIQYRYIYDAGKYGEFDLYGVQQRFTNNPSNPAPDDTSRSRTLGLFGEGAINARNIYTFGKRGVSRQILHLASNPYYYNNYSGDLAPEANLFWLRSQLSVTYPTDEWLFTGRIMHHQSLLASQDWGVDKGPVTQLPTLTASKTTGPIADLFGNLFTYEVDTQFNNYYRPWAYDNVPDHPTPTGYDLGNHATFGGNDFIRTGRRLQVEPRLLMNVPLPTGLQLQPMLTAGSLLYQFDVPTPQILHREYVQAEIPFSLYLHRTFHTSIAGYENISHVFQPRLVYGSTLYQSNDPNHPFFYRNRVVSPTSPLNPGTPYTLTSPRFDYLDQAPTYDYARLEIINRFRRQDASGVQRFLLFQLSDQYNISPDPTNLDPRYTTLWGPLELFTQMSFGSVTTQVEGNYQWQPAPSSNGIPFPKSLWSGTVSYNRPDGDSISLGTRVSLMADPTLNSQVAYLNWYKTLPTFFNLEGSLGYDFHTPGFMGYQIGFVVASKPTSCWSLEFITGKTWNNMNIATFNFHFDFGKPSGGARPL